MTTPSTTGADRRMGRALSAVRDLKSTDTLSQEAGFAPPPPPAPAGGGFVPPEGEPDKPSIPVLGGLLDLLGGAIDFGQRIPLALRYLGQYRDPSTGIVYQYNDRPDNIPSLVDIAPSTLGPLEPFIDPGAFKSRLESAAKFWDQYGLDPLEQMLQVAQFKTADEARAWSQKPETRAAFGQAQEILKGTGALAWSTITGVKDVPQLLYDLASGNRTVQEAMQQLAGVFPGGIQKVREAGFAAAADPTKYGEFSSMFNAVFGADSIAVGKIPVVALSKLGAGQIARLPIVGPASKLVLGKVQDLAGTMYNSVVAPLLEHLPSAKAARAGDKVHDTLGFLWHEAGGAADSSSMNTLVFTKAVRSFVEDDSYASKLLPYFSDTPEAIEARNLLKGHKDLIDSELRVLEGQQLSTHQVQQHLAATIENAVRKELYVPSRKAGFVENLMRGVEKVEGAWGNYWRPLVLDTRLDYLTNNWVTGQVMGWQRAGTTWLNAAPEMTRLETAGILPKLEYNKNGSFWFVDQLKMSEVEKTAMTRAIRFVQEGFSPAGVQRELPTVLKKLPVLGGWMNFIHKGSEVTERELHARSFSAELVKLQRESLAKLQGEFPGARIVLDGALSDAEVLKKVQELAKDIPSYEKFLGGSNSPRVEAALQLATQSLHKTKVLLEAGDVDQALLNARQLLTQDAILKKAIQDPDFMVNVLEDRAGKLYKGDAERARDLELKTAQETAQREHNAIASAIHNSTVNKSRTSKTLYTATSARFQSYHTGLKVLEEVYGKERAAVWNEFWDAEKAMLAKTHTQLHHNPRYSEEMAQMTDRYNEAWDKVAAVIGRRVQAEESALNIFVTAQVDSKSAEWLEKETARWLSKTDLYPVSDKVAARITAARRASKQGATTTTGGLDQETWAQLARLAGYKDSEIAGFFPKASQLIDDELTKDLGELDRLTASFGETKATIPGWRPPTGVEVDPKAWLSQKIGVDADELLSRVRDFTAKNMTMAGKVAEQTQFNYIGDQRVIDRYMKLFFPFSFFNTRYMAFQVKEAIRDPRQAYHMLKVIKTWADQNEDKPFWSKWNVSVMTMSPGTPDEVQVEFNPMYMIYPMGPIIGQVLSAANEETGQSVSQGFAALANFLGGQFHPFVLFPASLAGLSVDGGPMKSPQDILKGLIPPETWARQLGAAIPGAEQATLDLLTEQELNQVINQIRSDVNMGRLPAAVGKRAAALLKERKPDEVGLQYLQKVSGGLAFNTIAQAQFPVTTSFKPLGQQSLDIAYQALKASRTEAERSIIYENNPGLDISISGKRGDDLKLALLHLKAPDNPILRSMYYQAKHAEIDILQKAIDKDKGDEVEPYKLRAATPESFSAFRLAGGAPLIPDLANYWMRGRPLSDDAQTKLAGFYKKYGMGALSYDDWRDRVLPDAYRQWLLDAQKGMSRLGAGVKLNK